MRIVAAVSIGIAMAVLTFTLWFIATVALKVNGNGYQVLIFVVLPSIIAATLAWRSAARETRERRANAPRD